jgi:hypothetical protein
MYVLLLVSHPCCWLVIFYAALNAKEIPTGASLIESFNREIVTKAMQLYVEKLDAAVKLPVDAEELEKVRGVIWDYRHCHHHCYRHCYVMQDFMLRQPWSLHAVTMVTALLHWIMLPSVLQGAPL